MRDGDARVAGSRAVKRFSRSIDIVRTEPKHIGPPNEVQEPMNNVVKADNEKPAGGIFR
jgi:hypothetical protein